MLGVVRRVLPDDPLVRRLSTQRTLFALGTAAELWQSASGWGFVALLSDPARRGEYQGLWQIGYQVETIVGPALFTFLALSVGIAGWAVIALVAVLAAVVAHPAARAAQRYADGLPTMVR